jgi:hypothetical protein
MHVGFDDSAMHDVLLHSALTDCAMGGNLLPAAVHTSLPCTQATIICCAFNAVQFIAAARCLRAQHTWNKDVLSAA